MTDRPYKNVPDSLMGYRKNGPNKGYNNEKYKHSQRVRVTFHDGESFDDAVKGLNPKHAIERAKRNWPDAHTIFPLPNVD